MSDKDEPATEPDPGLARRRPLGRLDAARYRLGESLGQGGMGEVINARDLQIGRDVAIKRMLAGDPSETAINRFLREARIQGRLDHPAIVPVHELGRDSDGLPFFAMKRLAGTTLSKTLDQPREKLLRAFADVCLAVAFAHSRGVIHRDLKPANIVLGEFGEVYILDWGVAKLFGDGADSIESASGDTRATGTVAALGTPGYMAPEQVVDAASVDERADVYSLGCVLFEILTGQQLHPSGAPGMQSAVIGVDARASRRAPDRAIPPELDDLCVAATGRIRDQRLATARELADATLRYLDGDRDHARRRELASTHFAAARAAFDSGDEAQRRTAIREAGRALALDPTLAGAGELVGRLMLEPPRTLPREVENELAADAVDTDRRQARTSIWVAALYLGFLPFLLLAREWSLACVFVAYLAFNTIILRLRGRSASGRHPHWNALRNAVLVAIAGHAFASLLIGPGLAATTASALLLTASYTQPRRLVVLVAILAGAVMVPWLLEATGLIATTMTITDDGGILFRTPAIAVLGALHVPAFVFYTLGILVATVAVGHVMVRRDRESRRHLYLQAWQLRQLVS